MTVLCMPYASDYFMIDHERDGKQNQTSDNIKESHDAKLEQAGI